MQFYKIWKTQKKLSLFNNRKKYIKKTSQFLLSKAVCSLQIWNESLSHILLIIHYISLLVLLQIDFYLCQHFDFRQSLQISSKPCFQILVLNASGYENPSNSIIHNLLDWDYVIIYGIELYLNYIYLQFS